MDTEEDKRSLNLLEICRRVISEWQYVDTIQGRLVNVEEDVPILYPNNELMMHKLTYEPIKGESLELDRTSISLNELHGLKCTRITVYENHMFKNNEVINFKSFIEPSYNSDLIENGLANHVVVNSLSMQYKETLYWISKLKTPRSASIVLGIINAIPLLKMKGFKYWTLPNGQQVPLEALKMGVMECVPNFQYLVRTLHYMQKPGGIICGDTVLPRLLPGNMPEFTSKIKVRRYDPGIGAVMVHFFLHVPLGNENYYVVDPCSMGFNYRGPNKSLIMHGEWSEYAAKFPGQIVFKELDFKHHDGYYKLICDQAYWLGNGPVKNIDKLAAMLVKYINRRNCSYCGQIEGKHDECPTEQKYKHITIILLNCGRCKKVQYCDSLCQKSDWKNHKADCK